MFCDLFALCVYTCAHQFSSALQENSWENFLVTDFSFLLYVFFLIGNPGSVKNYMIFSLYERTLSCLVVGRWIRIKSDQHQLFLTTSIHHQGRSLILCFSKRIFFYSGVVISKTWKNSNVPGRSWWREVQIISGSKNLSLSLASGIKANKSSFSLNFL